MKYPAQYSSLAENPAVKENRDRVLSALSNSALRRPRGRITINLAPATVRKEGPSFDLPIALAMLQLNEQNRIPERSLSYLWRASAFG